MVRFLKNSVLGMGIMIYRGEVEVGIIEGRWFEIG